MSLINKTLVKTNLDIANKEEVINFLGSLLLRENRITDEVLLKQDVYKREEEAPTAMGWGIAIPHAQSESVLHSSLVFLKLKNKIMWNDEEVDTVFGIFMPKNKKEASHLLVLSTLARKIIDSNFRKRIKDSNDTDTGYTLLKEIEEELKQ